VSWDDSLSGVAAIVSGAGQLVAKPQRYLLEEVSIKEEK